jgi:uncharacterized membrane protein YphA (DoxX/SURF4 family)
MPSTIGHLDALHAAVRQIKPLRWFTVAVRVLLAIGFVIPGNTKLLNWRFTGTGPDEVGIFFDLLYTHSGLLYQFIGAVQIIAGLLLLIPRTALLGALVYLPTMSGIVVLTWSLDFHFTWVITTLMLLGVIYLICWDWHRIKYLLIEPTPAAPAAGRATPASNATAGN